MKNPLEGIAIDLHNHATALLARSDNIDGICRELPDGPGLRHLKHIADELEQRGQALHWLANNVSNAAKKAA